MTEIPAGVYGPVRWETLPPHVYPSGAVLRGFNDAMNLKSGPLRMSVCHLKPGQDIEHHRHYTMCELYFLMSGRGQFRIDDQVFDVEEHSACYFTPEPMRSVANNSNEDAWWLFVGTPPVVKPGQEPPPEVRALDLPTIEPPPDLKPFYGPVRWETMPVSTVDTVGAEIRGFTDTLNLKSGLLRASVCRLPAGHDMQHHRHSTMTEIHYLMKGQGQLRVEDTVIDVPENSGVYVVPEPMRSCINNSNEDAWWFFAGSPPDVKKMY